jgi:hypothetical protein
MLYSNSEIEKAESVAKQRHEAEQHPPLEEDWVLAGTRPLFFFHFCVYLFTVTIAYYYFFEALRTLCSFFSVLR